MKVIIANDEEQAIKIAGIFEHSIDEHFIRISPNSLLEEGGIITWLYKDLFVMSNRELSNQDDFDQPLDNLPVIPENFSYLPSENHEEHFEVINSLLKSDEVDEVVIATNSNREGEALGKTLTILTKTNKPLKRLLLNDLTDTGISKAFESISTAQNRKSIYFESFARMFGDWLIRTNASKAYSYVLNEAGIQGEFPIEMLTPAFLSHVSEREKEVKEKVVWEVYADFKFGDRMLRGKWVNDEGSTHIAEESQAVDIKRTSFSQSAVVKDYQVYEKEFRPPQLLNLAALQLVASRKYGMSAKNVENACYQLYLKGHISFPYTTSRHIPSAVLAEVPAILETLKVGTKYGKIIETLNPCSADQRFVSDDQTQLNHAIVPTKDVPDGKKLNLEEIKVYDLICRSLFAICCEGIVYEYTNLKTVVEETNQTFLTKQKKLINEGWSKVVYPMCYIEVIEDDIDYQKIDKDIRTGDTFYVDNTQHSRRALYKPYTEGDIVSIFANNQNSLAYEDNGELVLGTEESVASYIESLKTDGYISVNKNMVALTSKGKDLLKALSDFKLSDIEHLREWESRLHQIGSGESEDIGRYFEDIKQLTKEMVEHAKALREAGSLASTTAETTEIIKKKTEPPKGLGPCKICGQTIIDNGNFYGCSSYLETGCTFTIPKILRGQTITPNNVKKLLYEGSTDIIHGFLDRMGKTTWSGVLYFKGDKLDVLVPDASKLKLPLSLLEPLPDIVGQNEEASKDIYTLERETQVLNHPAKVLNVIHGPRVDRFELLPQAGLNIGAYKRFQYNLKAALRATEIRLLLPVPGKNLIGIEAPAKKPYPVQLRGLLEDPTFLSKSSKRPLTFPIGMDVEKRVIFADLAEMPHLLIAGSTGSGKSVFLNSLIVSLLYLNDPEDLKLVFIDPKRVELSKYEGIPHLRNTVITDPKKSRLALKNLVAEMDKRYDMLSDAGVRDINSYNAKMEQEGKGKMPYIVLVVDELADLMMVANEEGGGDVEYYITRLAQLSRAAGIHLVLATQRPTKKVISPNIKANMPVRIAFSVAASNDSMVILDETGAEDLLGKGDMIFLPKSGGKERLQSAYLSDEEIDRAIDYLIKSKTTAKQAVANK